MTRLADLVTTSNAVAATSRRREKVALLAAALRRLARDEVETGAAFLSGAMRQGRLGIGYATLAALPSAPAAKGSLELREVDRAFERIAAIKGEGSAAARERELGELFARATRAERDFLTRLTIGEIHQGALEGVMLEAIAEAAALPAADVRRAAMLAGGLPTLAAAALGEGASGLARFAIRPLAPVQPMLAQPVDDIEAALAGLGRAAFEWKLDGARVQVHKSGGDVRVFTRNLNDVSASVPELVEAVRALPARELILDGETLALAPGGAPLPFQVSMRRFGRKLDVEALRRELPLSVFYFDCLRLDADNLLDRPARERFAALADALPAKLLIRRLVTGERAAAEAFYADALAHGHEGVVAKSLAARYEAGRRGAAWLKVKRRQTLDLVVLAAEWGHGRRQGWLSNLHLGARDPASGGFVMLGKTFKGLTDAMLEWQTQAFLSRETARDAYTVYLRPEIVVEIAFDELRASAQYPGGLALRFARVKRYRPDKRADESDTIDTVRALYAAQLQHQQPEREHA
jgi:DNA ligase-1